MNLSAVESLCAATAAMHCTAMLCQKGLVLTPAPPRAASSV